MEINIQAFFFYDYLNTYGKIVPVSLTLHTLSVVQLVKLKYTPLHNTVKPIPYSSVAI